MQVHSAVQSEPDHGEIKSIYEKRKTSNWIIVLDCLSNREKK